MVTIKKNMIYDKILKKKIFSYNKMENSKRIKTVSKFGNTYYKNPDERNRLAQRKHYDENSRQIKVTAILKSMERGMCPRPSTLKKYPEELTEDMLMERFRTFKKGCEDPELYLRTSKNFANLLKVL